jgi:MFS family permease
MTGGVPLGGAIGAKITGDLAYLGWERLYYVTAVIMVGGAAVYFIFARRAEHVVELGAAKGTAHPGVWSSLMTWLMGFVQIPLTWTLFTFGGFMPAYAFRLGYKVDQVGNVMFIWGVVGFFVDIVGALLGDRLVRGKTTNRGRVNARLAVMSLGDLLMAAGALMVLYLAPVSHALLLVAAIVLAFLFLIPANYWATPGAVYPLATIGAGAFAMGVISNSTSAIGPVVSSILVPTFGWSGVFWIMAILSLVGVGINAIAMRTTLPADRVAPPSS